MSYRKTFFVVTWIGCIALLLGLSTSPCTAASAADADRLKKDLTPFGAERAGNKDGSIPAWEGGMVGIPEGLGYKGGDQVHPDPFSQDKVLFTITAQNVDQYVDQLSDGQKALFKKYPEYKMNVYPSRRTHAMPEWIYDNIYKNVTRAKLTEDGLGMVGGYGGVPFPIPQRAEEIVFNHLMAWKGSSLLIHGAAMVVYPHNRTQGAGGLIYEKFPFYDEKGSPENYDGGLLYTFLKYETPARKKGEAIVLKDPANQSSQTRDAWLYMPGSRRVRRAPTLAYDTPSDAGSGRITWDQVNLFNGALDRYEWKLIGKKERYIPYNAYAFDLATEDENFTPNFPNPEYSRWELHRVWVIEANLKPDKRHIYAKRVLYIDEDSWNAVLQDCYDGRGELWKTDYNAVKNAYQLPGVISRANVFFDFRSDAYAVYRYLVNGRNGKANLYQDLPDDMFTPEHIRSVGNR